ncbi:MAG: A/G-specific adenine glycosylase [Chloroflexota bacterium]
MEEAVKRTRRRRLLRWYSRHGRALPSRTTHDPYAVLVSEIMLQQTQVTRVVPAYLEFLRRFPTPRALARASLGDVLRVWSGLGYNRRARDLHRIARLAAGGIPTDLDALDAFPGVGAYTAGAVACFSTGARVPFADTNIRRVLGRVVLGRTATEREAVAIDQELMPRDAAAWHHAVMDLGATVCVSRAPRCATCPLRTECRARGRSTPTPRRQQAPFANSTRRLRGRVVALLAATPSGMTTHGVGARLADDRVDVVLDELVRDGLIERRRGRVSLPA